MAGLKYDDLPEKIKKEIEAMYPGPENPDRKPKDHRPTQYESAEEWFNRGGLERTLGDWGWESYAEDPQASIENGFLAEQFEREMGRRPKTAQETIDWFMESEPSLSGGKKKFDDLPGNNELIDAMRMMRYLETPNKENLEKLFNSIKPGRVQDDRMMLGGPVNTLDNMIEQVYATNHSETMTRREFQDYSGYWGFSNKKPPVNEEVLRGGETNILDAALKLAMPTENDPVGGEEPDTPGDDGASAIDKMVPNYKPGNRESANVEDRREFMTMSAKPLEPLKAKD